MATRSPSLFLALGFGAALCLSAPVFGASASFKGGGGKSGGLFGGSSPGMNKAVAGVISSPDFAPKGFGGLLTSLKLFDPDDPAAWTAFDPIARVLPPNFAALDQTTQKVLVAWALPLALKAVEDKMAGLIADGGRDDPRLLARTMTDMERMRRLYSSYLTKRSRAALDTAHEKIATKHAALLLRRAGTTAEALRSQAEDSSPAAKAWEASGKPGRVETARTILEHLRGSEGKDAADYEPLLAKLVALTEERPDEGLERVIVRGLLGLFPAGSLYVRSLSWKGLHAAARLALTDIARRSRSTNTQMLVLRGLMEDAHPGVEKTVTALSMPMIYTDEDRVATDKARVAHYNAVQIIGLDSESKKVKALATDLLERARRDPKNPASAAELAVIALNLEALAALTSPPGKTIRSMAARVGFASDATDDRPLRTALLAGLAAALLLILPLVFLDRYIYPATESWKLMLGGGVIAMSLVAGVLSLAFSGYNLSKYRFEREERRVLIIRIAYFHERPYNTTGAKVASSEVQKLRDELYRGYRNARSLEFGGRRLDDLTTRELRRLEASLQEQDEGRVFFSDN